MSRRGALAPHAVSVVSGKVTPPGTANGVDLLGRATMAVRSAGLAPVVMSQRHLFWVATVARQLRLSRSPPGPPPRVGAPSSACSTTPHQAVLVAVDQALRRISSPLAIAAGWWARSFQTWAGWSVVVGPRGAAQCARDDPLLVAALHSPSPASRGPRVDDLDPMRAEASLGRPRQARRDKVVWPFLPPVEERPSTPPSGSSHASGLDPVLLECTLLGPVDLVAMPTGPIEQIGPVAWTDLDTGGSPTRCPNPASILVSSPATVPPQLGHMDLESVRFDDELPLRLLVRYEMLPFSEGRVGRCPFKSCPVRRPRSERSQIILHPHAAGLPRRSFSVIPRHGGEQSHLCSQFPCGAANDWRKNLVVVPRSLSSRRRTSC